jgi:hypothetical protein
VEPRAGLYGCRKYCLYRDSRANHPPCGEPLYRLSYPSRSVNVVRGGGEFAVGSKILLHMRRLDTLCVHNVGFTNGKAGRTQSRHSALVVNPWVILLQSCNVARLIADKVF